MQIKNKHAKMSKDERYELRAKVTKVERTMADKVKDYYKIKTDKELILALIKRAHLNIT